TGTVLVGEGETTAGAVIGATDGGEPLEASEQPLRPDVGKLSRAGAGGVLRVGDVLHSGQHSIGCASDHLLVDDRVGVALAAEQQDSRVRVESERGGELGVIAHGE